MIASTALTFSPSMRTAGRATLLLALSLSAMTAHGQSLHVAAANSANSAVYDVNFSGSGGSITTRSTDQNQHVAIRSLVYVANTVSGTVDLIAADGSSGGILRYVDGKGTAQSLWNPSRGPGPVAPDGLSADADGNLYVVSSGNGTPKSAQLWVLPRNQATGNYGAPRLIDKTFKNMGVQQLTETLVVRGAGSVAPGSLLVLSGNPASVFVYPAAKLAPYVSNPTAPAEINAADVGILLAPAQFPTGASPRGMDFWPLDNTLLITTAGGRILRYTAGGALLADFANGLGNGVYKIRTGWDTGQAFAFVTISNGGRILKFRERTGSDPANNPPVATITKGVQSPQGIATTNMAVANLSTCLELNGCDLLGGVIKHKIQNLQTVSGTLIEDICIVQNDPRVQLLPGEEGPVLLHDHVPLAVSEVCPGFGNTAIPNFLFGSAGASRGGFALIRSSRSATASPAGNGALIVSEANVANVLGATNGVNCPDSVVGWAPTSSNEGTPVEGDEILELTTGCGSSVGDSWDESLWAVGLALDVSLFEEEGEQEGELDGDEMRLFAVSKYGRIDDTLGDIIAQLGPGPVPTILANLQSCIATSRDKFNDGLYVDAAVQLVVCDSQIRYPGSELPATTRHPNSTGELRARLGNLYLTLDTRMLGHTAIHPWPPNP